MDEFYEQADNLVNLLDEIYPRWATTSFLSKKTDIEETQIELCMKAMILTGDIESSKTRDGKTVWRNRELHN